MSEPTDKTLYEQVKAEIYKKYPKHAVLNFPIPQKHRNVYISYHTLKKHLADIKSVIDSFNKL